MAQKFKSGTLVKLKSGGPAMTVDSHGYSGGGKESSTVHCKWFAGAKSESANFNEETLVEFDPAAEAK